jgi:hypothetical protein
MVIEKPPVRTGGFFVSAADMDRDAIKEKPRRSGVFQRPIL